MRVYFRILGFGKGYWHWGLGALIALVVFTLFSAASLLAVVPFLEILFQENPLPPPELPLAWMDTESLKAHGYYQLSQYISLNGAQQALWYFCVGLFGAIVIRNAARYISAFCMAPLEQGILYKLREQVFAHIGSLDLSFFTRRKKGDLVGILVSDVQVVQEAIIGTLQALIREPLTILTFFGMLLFLSWKLTLFTLIILPLTGLLINRIAGPLKRKARAGQTVLGQLVSVIDEFLSNIRIVKAFQQEAYEKSRYAEQNQHYFRLQVGIRRQTELASPLTEIISIAVVCMIIYYAGQLILVDEAGLKRSEFITFIAFFSQLLSPIKVLSNALAKIQKGMAAFSRIEALQALEPSISQPAEPVAIPHFEREIRFSEVGFAYEDMPVLQDINLAIPKGQTVALVGPSGAGKSTLADLLPRFHDPQKGSVSIDGHDLRQLDLTQLRRLVGVVTQEATLFHSSVRENIAYGQPQADPKMVEKAARMAHAHDFIMELPEGYETQIGERGTALSGGQRQRLAIARAIFRDPEILILDEATSNLDTQSEQLVQVALQELMRGRTSLVIAHRLSTIQAADLIVVLDQGRIVQKGTHADLLAREGLYRTLYEVQFQRG